MNAETFRPLFAAIDAADPVRFADFLAADAQFRFGNYEPVHGRDAVRAYVTGFFGSIAGLRHELVALVRAGDVVTAHGHVTYTRHDGSTLRVPFANVFHLDDAGLIRDYLIFIDNHELYG